MSLSDQLVKIENLQNIIEEYGPISADLLNKINYKLRLEWNYTSNSMEGNSLTKRETRTVMVGMIDVNDKPIKDVMEIRSHDSVISAIMKIGKGELNVSESRIKDIHKGIMYEEDPEKQKYIGQWKNTDNYMINFNNERYDFVPHTQVMERMHNLVNWVNTEKEKIVFNKKDAIHPLILASKFHIDYLTIHPFYDGNGRTARILSNLILISYGYPPVYIKENEKQRYYGYLTDIQSYGGEPDLFYEFMADLLLRSLQIVLDSLEGKEIEEDDDVNKEIALFKLSLDKSSERKESRNWQNTSKILKETGVTIFQQLINKLSQFDELFNSHEHRILFSTDKSQKYSVPQRRGGSMLPTVKFPETFLTWIESPTGSNAEINSLGMEYLFKGYKFSDPYDLPVFLLFSFNDYTYTISFTTDGYVFEDFGGLNNYDQLVGADDIKHLVNEVTKRVLDIVKSR